MLPLYMDEDSMDHALVSALRARSVDVLTAQEAGMIGRNDDDHLIFATESGRVLCTFNIGDFWALHADYLARGRRHTGMIPMPQQRYSLGERLRRLLRIASVLSSATMIDRTEFLSDWEPGDL